MAVSLPNSKFRRTISYDPEEWERVFARVTPAETTQARRKLCRASLSIAAF